MRRRILAACLACLFATAASADDVEFRPLFNGSDLSGWVNVNCAPETFSVRDGMIVCTGFPTGVMRTDRHYENFILELEWRHMKPKGNAGLFVWSDPVTSRGVPFTRSIEVQVLDGRNTENYTSHGDIFSIHGASMKPDREHPDGPSVQRCLPSERRCKPSPEWNHYRVVCKDGVIKLSVNGKEVSGGSLCNPRRGYICLESEGSEVHFRNIKIHELPPSQPDSSEIAGLDTGFQSIYTGLDLRGWQVDDRAADNWTSRDWILNYDGKSKAQAPQRGHLTSEQEYGDFELICDWRLTGQPTQQNRPIVLPNGNYALDADGKKKLALVDDAGQSGIYLRGHRKGKVSIWCWPIGSGEIFGYRTDTELGDTVRAGVTPRLKADRAIGQWNRFHISLRGDRVTVELNGETVIENARLPGIPERGPIVLQDHGDPIQFANIYIKELE